MRRPYLEQYRNPSVSSNSQRHYTSTKITLITAFQTHALQLLSKNSEATKELIQNIGDVFSILRGPLFGNPNPYDQTQHELNRERLFQHHKKPDIDNKIFKIDSRLRLH